MLPPYFIPFPASLSLFSNNLVNGMLSWLAWENWAKPLFVDWYYCGDGGGGNGTNCQNGKERNSEKLDESTNFQLGHRINKK